MITFDSISEEVNSISKIDALNFKVGCRNSDIRGPKSEVRTQKSEVGSRKSEIRKLPFSPRFSYLSNSNATFSLEKRDSVSSNAIESITLQMTSWIAL